MNIIIENTTEAISEATSLVSCINSFNSILNTISYVKSTLDEIWISGNEIKSIDENIDKCLFEYREKILKAMEKLSKGIIAYAMATEKIASSGEAVDGEGNLMTPSEVTAAYYADIDNLSQVVLEKNENGELEVVNGSFATYLEQKLDLKSLGYSSGQEYIDSVVNEAIANAGTNREKSVAAVTAITNLAAENGVKLDYEWSGGHWRAGSEKVVVVENSDLSSGVDCSGFVSWAVQNGSTPPESFPACGTSELIGRGTKTSNVSAQPGDIIVRNSGNYGHTGFIVKNDTDTGTMLIAEAHSNSEGIILKEYSYNDLAYQGYSIRDMSSYYGDNNSASM